MSGWREQTGGREPDREWPEGVGTGNRTRWQGTPKATGRKTLRHTYLTLDLHAVGGDGKERGAGDMEVYKSLVKSPYA